jgi:hypothetical protein
MTDLSIIINNIYKASSPVQMWRTLCNLVSPYALHNICISPSSTQDEKDVALMLLMQVAMSAKNCVVSYQASQYLNQLGHTSWNYDLLKALMDKFNSNPQFYNVVIRLLHLVGCHVRGEMIDGPYIKDAVDNFRHSYVVWKFQCFFTTQTPLADLRKVFGIVMALYEQDEPCVHHVSLFQHMRNVLTERLHMCDNEEEKNSIQKMRMIISEYFATHVMEFFTDKAPLSDLQSMVEMVVELHEESKELRLKLMAHFLDMRDILNELVLIVGSDANESTSIRAMLKTLEDMLPAT